MEVPRIRRFPDSQPQEILRQKNQSKSAPVEDDINASQDISLGKFDHCKIKIEK